MPGVTVKQMAHLDAIFRSVVHILKEAGKARVIVDKEPSVDERTYLDSKLVVLAYEISKSSALPDGKWELIVESLEEREYVHMISIERWTK